MAYNHGVKVSEVPTSIQPPVEVSAGIPLIVGAAPINMTDTTNVNKPKLCYSYDEAVAAFGFVSAVEEANTGLKKYEYSISEAIYSQFALYGVSPVIIINVLDPTKHKVTATTTSVTLDTKTGSATIKETGIIPSSVTIDSYAKDTDYKLTFDKDGNLVISSLVDTSGKFKVTTGSSLTLSAEKVDPSKVTAEDIIGGVDTTGNKSGLELIDECFPRFRLVAGNIIAPGYSENPTVAAVMAAKAESINEVYKASALIDVPTDTVKQYTDVPTWKNNNNVTDKNQVVLFPMLASGGVKYHYSTQLAGLMGKVDAEHGDVPYYSPSNQNLVMDAAVLADGTEVWLDQPKANYLNGEGVVTAINFIGGWKCWGNRTACYPANTDVKDAFISVRRMFNWIGNTFVQTFWKDVDAPLNRRQIDTIVDSANIWLNGLAAQGYILGGRVEFLASENSTADLMDGKARFHVYVTPPSPNREIDFILEYDPAYVQTLFS